MNPTAFDPTKFGATPIDLATDTGGDTSTFDPTQFGAVPFDASEFGATPMEPEPTKSFRYEVADPVFTPEQKAENFKVNYANAVANAEKSAKEAKKANSFLGKLGATVKGVGETLASSEIGLGKTIAKAFDKKTVETASKNIEMLVQTQIQTQKSIREFEKQGKDASGLKRAYNSIQDTIDENKKTIDDFNASLPSNKKVLGQIGGTALDIVTAGSSKAATTEAKVAIKSKSLAPAIKNPIAGKLVKSTTPTIKKITTAVGLPEVGKVAEIADKPAGLFTKKGASTVAKGAGVGYAYDITEGLQGNRGENREGGKALIPGLGTAFGASIPVASETTQSFKNKVKPSVDIIEDKILNKFTKGVRPLLPGKTTLGRMKDYKVDVIDAVKTIKDNKANLKFNTSAGETVVGKNPRSLQQLSEAIEQTKKTVFREYDSLAKKAGGEGVGVEMAPIASELDAVIGNKALAITNPKAIRYAQQTQSRLIRAGKLDAETAQEVVQNYNKSLEAFYRNPSYDTASNAAIDAMLANRVRQSLDDGISGLTGSEYGELKRKYGSLKAIEKDVIKATLRDARKNTKGLIDFTDIFSGGQIVNGILSLNPATISQGIASKAIAEFYKYLNNPNRAIEKMFDVADKLPATQSRIGPKSLLQTKPNTSIPITPNTNVISPIIPKAKPVVNDIKKAEATMPKIVKRDLSLRGNDAKVQEASIKKYESNPEKMVDDYIKQNGKIVNTDEARKLFKDEGYVGTNARAVQEASSAVSKDAFRKLLNNSEGEDALFTVGGSGTGKTSVVKNMFPEEYSNAGVILDSNLSKMQSAGDRIQEVLDAGKKPNLIYVYRDPIDSWINGVVKRMNNKTNDEGGRIVPLSVFIENHKGSYNVIKSLLQNPDNGKKFKISLIDNSLGQGNHELLDPKKFGTISYNDNLKEQLLEETKKLYEKGQITKVQYQELIQ